MKKHIIPYFVLTSLFINCKKTEHITTIKPDVITQKTINDTDDPAIWVNSKNPTESIIFGTDKETNGAIYAFDLNGKIIENKTIRNVKRPNNVDLIPNFKLNNTKTVAILAFAEREKQQIRIYSVPEMQPLDNGGIKVFEDEINPEFKLPMGIAFYTSPITQKTYVIVGRKTGPKKNYLFQY